MTLHNANHVPTHAVYGNAKSEKLSFEQQYLWVTWCCDFYRKIVCGVVFTKSKTWLSLCPLVTFRTRWWTPVSSSFTFAWRTKYGIRSLILQPAIVTSHTQLWGLTRVPLKDRRTRIGGCLFLQHLQSFNTHFRERWRLYSCATSMMNFAKWFRSLNKYIAHSTRQEGPRQWSTLVQLWCLLDSIGIVGR